MLKQLDAILADLHAAERRLHALRERLPAGQWNRRPAPEQWSPAECVAHLNLTSEAFLPRIREGLERARREGTGRVQRYRRDLIGWIIWTIVTPTGRFRSRTPAAFVPSADTPAEVLIAEFERLNAEIASCIRTADGLPIDRVKVASPFDARASYNLYAALTIIPRHQHRHLLQAERAAAASGAYN